MRREVSEKSEKGGSVVTRSGTAEPPFFVLKSSTLLPGLQMSDPYNHVSHDVVKSL